MKQSTNYGGTGGKKVGREEDEKGEVGRKGYGGGTITYTLPSK